ncbi:D-glycero-beta-D-manno-heptose-7-phosphate kinase [Aquibium sp. A9E412]|uniref:D-glycero-beta-D-manno-heptose-7-phosphate kinase n=1 Tax=Aquibium sp. A9E412 TaxID=2976767 RepID=UPI0025B0DF55|nr:D-glycero-beta-D-manno-heptose-7-phosphate kinase [Aquibium sp. A9E412]MDN2565457.1 D-glycero-beta-D-manno-heptose-7-phosphate kinase [Aquibium sp. A9E412]
MSDTPGPSLPQDGGPTADLARRFAGLKVLVAGDFILDRFVNGTIERISPEAPIPVLHGRGESAALGGAGNVVANVTALGAQALPVAAIGDDAAARRILALLGERGVAADGLFSSRGRMTPCKSRFSALNQQVLRFDEEEVRALAPDERETVLARFDAALAGADIVILSDYGKGMLADGMAAALIARARAAGRPVLVDPKGGDYARYAGATAVTPNRKELGEAVGRPVHGDAEIAAAGQALIAAHGFSFVLATRSEKGMSVIEADGARHIATEAREVFDVSGAGDTVVASFALALAAGYERGAAAALANAAAGVVVGKRGTAQLTVDELTAALSRTHDPAGAAEQVVNADAAARLVAAWRREGLTVGFTNGCFDILHAGHVSLLQSARRACDRLVVGLNSDASVRRLKGAGRPVNGERDRAFVLAGLAAVDLVVVFGEDTPLALIRRLDPDLLVKGADYTPETVVGADHVTARGGRVMLVDLVGGRSTTATIDRLTALRDAPVA